MVGNQLMYGPLCETKSTIACMMSLCIVGGFNSAVSTLNDFPPSLFFCQIFVLYGNIVTFYICTTFRSVSASVGSMYMTGVPHDSCPTILLSSQVVGVTTTTAGDTPLLKFGLEMNPLDQSDMDMVIRADLRPIQITYDAVSSCA